MMVSSLLGKHKHACMSKYKNLKIAFRACSVPCIGFSCCVPRTDIHVFKSCLTYDNQSSIPNAFLKREYVLFDKGV